jgi:hypothetical protein
MQNKNHIIPWEYVIGLTFLKRHKKLQVSEAFMMNEYSEVFFYGQLCPNAINFQ